MTNLSEIATVFDGYIYNKIFAEEGIALGTNAVTELVSDYTLINGDNGKVLVVNSSTAVVITYPTGILPPFSCTVIQMGTGQVSVVASGTTLRTIASQNKTAAQYAMMSLFSYISNELVIGGNVSA